MLQGRAVNATALQLSWQPPPVDEQNGVIRLYTVVLRESQTGQTIVYNTTMTQLTVGSLMPCMSYNWSVTPYTVGYGPVPRGYYSVNTQLIINGKFVMHVESFISKTNTTECSIFLVLYLSRQAELTRNHSCMMAYKITAIIISQAAHNSMQLNNQESHTYAIQVNECL